ncbi:MAG: radical SAM protein [Rhodospirillales bacterium]|nr:radical SAM protein [Rhodospirillales bacterium]
MNKARPITVGLAQINNGFSGQHYLPYSAGFLQAYTAKHAADPSRYQFLLPLYKRTHRDEAVAHLSTADVVGMSVYVWNINISLAIAKALKAARPDRLIVFGGPQVPDEGEDLMIQNTFIDIAVHGEGERTFLKVLETFPDGDWGAIPGISYRAPDGTIVRTPAVPRLRDLTSIPSPYLSGTFDPLIDANPDETWIAMWETNRGCPFSCTFCDWGSAVSAKLGSFEIDQVKAEVKWFADHRVEFIFCCDANFGILPRDVEIATVAAESRRRYGFPKALSVQNTKNATERAYTTQKILADAGLSKGVTISLQSTDPHTLDVIKRHNISTKSFMELQRRFARAGVVTYTDFIIGLPGETVESFCSGVSGVIETGQHNRIQFNNLTILPNAEMAQPRYIAEHGMATVDIPIVNMHGTLDDTPDGIAESQKLVIATNKLPKAEWRRVKTYAWFVSLLHFDKLLQIPLLMLHHDAEIPFRRMFEAFVSVDSAQYPLLGAIRDFFESEARAMQDGSTEYRFAPDWLGIYWPQDEYAFIDLAVSGKLEAFYAEAERLLGSLAPTSKADAIADAIRLNNALLKRPFQERDLKIDLDWDLLTFWHSVRTGGPSGLEHRPVSYRIERSKERWSTWDSWMQEVVWYGHRRGAYLYGSASLDRAIAGHY